jgi:hypothetical protein
LTYSELILTLLIPSFPATDFRRQKLGVTPPPDSTAALPDSGFLRQIWTILADLKVIWQAKNISCGLPICGGFLADLTNFVRFSFCLADSGGFGVSIGKKQHFFLTFSCKKKFKTKLFCAKYFQKR